MQLLTIRAAGFSATVDACARDDGQIWFLSLLGNQQSDLVRSEKDVPIALTLLASDVDIFVTNDRDFTDPDAAAQRFRDRVRVMLPAVFLREVMGWRAEDLEAIRNRTWRDIPVEEPSEESDG